MESFYQPLRTEEVNLHTYLDLDDAHQHLDRFIRALYSQERLYSNLGYVPPTELAARYHSA